LREQLAALQASHKACQDALARLDEIGGAVATPAVVNGVLRAMRQRAIERATTAVNADDEMAAGTRGWRVPTWLYAAAAAMVLLAMGIGWWGMSGISKTEGMVAMMPMPTMRVESDMVYQDQAAAAVERTLIGPLDAMQDLGAEVQFCDVEGQVAELAQISAMDTTRPLWGLEAER
jgi:hypothetical protein